MAIKVRIITVQKIKDRGVEGLIGEYVKRFPQQWNFELLDCRGDRLKSKTEQEQRDEGSALFLARASSPDYLICLDERGEQYDSFEFSNLFHQLLDEGRREITFGLGGPAGWSGEVKTRADRLLSLGSLTYPYQLSALLLVEQLYRAHTIRQNIPYHK